MIMSKILGGASVVLLISTLALYGLWQHSQSKVAVLEGKVATLENAHAVQQTTIDGLQTLANSNAAIIEGYGQQVEDAANDARSLQTVIDKLRLTEGQAALEEPFARGNASYDRQYSNLLRFSATPPSANDPGVADSHNSPPTDTP